MVRYIIFACRSHVALKLRAMLYWSLIMSFVMPVSPVDNKPVYNTGSSVADVFLACARPNGATIAEIKKLLNTDVAIYPLTRHADVRGRRGLRWDIKVDGKPLADRFTVDLPATSRVSIVNIRPSEKFVNSKHPRSQPADSKTLIAARSVVATDVPTKAPEVKAAVVTPVAVTKTKKGGKK